jgi:hypothetical protein
MKLIIAPEATFYGDVVAAGIIISREDMRGN